MKKCVLISVTAIMVFFTSVFTVSNAEEKAETNQSLDLAKNAKSAILMERDTGTVIYDKNSHEKLPPASMTKIMTLLLVMEALDLGELKLGEMIRISERAASMGGSQIFLGEGEEMSVNDLLKGIAIASGNDASVAIAERISGSEEAFVNKMNEKVAQLQLENTHFQNASGLPAEEHYSTSYDMAIISQELLKYETITEYTSIYEDYLRKGEKNEFWLVNTNKLVRFYPGVDGLKTGYTNEAKYCLAATAKKNDMRVITVVMGVETVKQRNATISQMLDYAFNHYDTKKLFSKGEKVSTLHHLKAEANNIDVIVPESVSTLHKKGDASGKVVTSVNINDFRLPLKKGDSIGNLSIKQEDKIIKEVPLVVKKDVKSATFKTLLKRSLKNIAKYR